MTKNRTHKSLAFVLIGAAALLHAYKFAQGTPGAMAFFFLWSMGPYILCGLVMVLSRGAIHVISAAAVALTLDTLTLYAVSTSDSSTAVLDYLWMPVWNTIFFVPLTMLAVLAIAHLRGVLRATSR